MCKGVDSQGSCNSCTNQYEPNAIDTISDHPIPGIASLGMVARSREIPDSLASKFAIVGVLAQASIAEDTKSNDTVLKLWIASRT